MDNPTDAKPPPLPWKPGKHEDHEVIHIEVLVCKDKYDRVFSTHALHSPMDEQVARMWKSGATQQVAFALLTEALRREAVVGLLVKLTDNPKYLIDFLAMPQEQRDAELEAMSVAMLGTVGKTAHQMARDIVREAVENVVQDILGDDESITP